MSNMFRRAILFKRPGELRINLPGRNCRVCTMGLSRMCALWGGNLRGMHSTRLSHCAHSMLQLFSQATAGASCVSCNPGVQGNCIHAYFYICLKNYVIQGISPLRRGPPRVHRARRALMGYSDAHKERSNYNVTNVFRAPCTCMCVRGRVAWNQNAPCVNHATSR